MYCSMVYKGNSKGHLSPAWWFAQIVANCMTNAHLLYITYLYKVWDHSSDNQILAFYTHQDEIINASYLKAESAESFVNILKYTSIIFKQNSILQLPAPKLCV